MKYLILFYILVTSLAFAQEQEVPLPETIFIQQKPFCEDWSECGSGPSLSLNWRSRPEDYVGENYHGPVTVYEYKLQKKMVVESKTTSNTQILVNGKPIEPEKHGR